MALVLSRQSLRTLDEAEVRAQLPEPASSITLSNNYLAAFSLLGPALPTLTSLDLTCNELCQLPQLDAARGLRRLCLGHNRIGDLNVPLLLPCLVELDLQHNQLAVLSPLAGCPALKRLSLSCNPIARVSADARFPRLQRLGMFGHALPDLDPLEGLIAGSPELRRLTVAGGACTPAAGPDVPHSPEQQQWRLRLLRAQPSIRWLDCEYVDAKTRWAAACPAES
jgi:hypothetical protein